ncbi:MAG: class I SAM-dependent methyltransferase [Gammaproteobacteria bacterium]|nr:MAG: class I SAM-dependent methyltransferase [Gammaproteobacteria bacterium]
MSGDEENGIPAHFFARADESPDEHFYAEPRLVAHIDQATIDALTSYYREFIPTEARVLDLMSSWISHLPEEAVYAHVTGLGMNARELEANKQLNDFLVQNLNDNPILPYAPGSFDRAMIAVSIQYLTRPIEVLSSVHESLAEGGAICIAMSHRLFPTKAIAAFQQLPARERIQLVGYYLDQAGFADVNFEDRSPANADPLWLVTGKKLSLPKK